MLILSLYLFSVNHGGRSPAPELCLEGQSARRGGGGRRTASGMLITLLFLNFVPKMYHPKYSQLGKLTVLSFFIDWLLTDWTAKLKTNYTNYLC